jgi:hypothetical protein
MPESRHILGHAHDTVRDYKTDERMFDHAPHYAQMRLLNACEIISWTGGLGFEWIGRTPSFTVDAAHFQDGRARGGQHQAAHALPGQLLINGELPWYYVDELEQRVAWYARFAVTAAVRTSLNMADSAAEHHGLVKAFRQACEVAWKVGKRHGTDIRPVFSQFLEDASFAFFAARQAKIAQAELDEREGRPDAGKNRRIEARLLREYSLHGATPSMAESLFPLKRTALRASRTIAKANVKAVATR